MRRVGGSDHDLTPVWFLATSKTAGTNDCLRLLKYILKITALEGMLRVI